jgi:hypothetical protein
MVIERMDHGSSSEESTSISNRIKSTQHLDNVHSQIKPSLSRGGFAHVDKKKQPFQFHFEYEQFYEKIEISRGLKSPIRILNSSILLIYHHH